MANIQEMLKTSKHKNTVNYQSGVDICEIVSTIRKPTDHVTRLTDKSTKTKQIAHSHQKVLGTSMHIL